MCTFSAIRTEPYYKKRDSVHEDTFCIQLCFSILKESGINVLCCMNHHEVWSADSKAVAFVFWPNIQIQGRFTKYGNTLMRGTLFWHWCTHATCTYDWLQHYSFEAMDHAPYRPDLVPREFHFKKHQAVKQLATESNVKHQPSPPGQWDLTPISSLSTYKSWCYGGTNIQMSMMTACKLAVYRVLP